MNDRKRVVGIGSTIAGILVGLLLVAPGVLAKSMSPEARLCGAERNTIQAEFDLDHAKGIFRVFPAMGRTPELETDGRTAHVVVFRGDFDPSGMQFMSEKRPPHFQRVVCVVQADGVMNLYFDVSRNGSKFAD